VERPPYARLKREVAAMGWSAVGRRYGVSDNAVRKWVRAYEREVGRDPPPAANNESGVR
jgi:transposase-like protein